MAEHGKHFVSRNCLSITDRLLTELEAYKKSVNYEYVAGKC